VAALLYVKEINLRGTQMAGHFLTREATSFEIRKVLVTQI